MLAQKLNLAEMVRTEAARQPGIWSFGCCHAAAAECEENQSGPDRDKGADLDMSGSEGVGSVLLGPMLAMLGPMAGGPGLPDEGLMADEGPMA